MLLFFILGESNRIIKERWNWELKNRERNAKKISTSSNFYFSFFKLPWIDQHTNGYKMKFKQMRSEFPGYFVDVFFMYCIVSIDSMTDWWVSLFKFLCFVSDIGSDQIDIIYYSKLLLIYRITITNNLCYYIFIFVSIKDLKCRIKNENSFWRYQYSFLVNLVLFYCKEKVIYCILDF